jgi:nucleoside-diphosphate-sugar epimerase
MRVVVVGATGNVGTSLLDALGRDDRVDAVVGLARRLPSIELPKVEWRLADVISSDLEEFFRGADAVVHLAWQIQPSRDLRQLRRINVEGSQRVFRAVGEADVPVLVYASSVGAYSPGPKERRVDESWPVDGIRTSFYSRHKSEVEHMLDDFERERPEIRVVRLRPALIFKRGAASEIRRLFVGPLLPSPLARLELLRLVPDVPGLRVQAVHSLDVGDAYRLAVTGDARGAFNIAADPPLDAKLIARLAGGRAVRVPQSAARAAVSLSWRLRLQPSQPGWLDLGVGVPLLDTTRAHEELGWRPRRSATDALVELLDGLREHAGLETPPLESDAGGPARARELASGVGSRER